MGKYSDFFTSLDQQSQQPDTYVEIDKPATPAPPDNTPSDPQATDESRSILKDAAGLWGVGSGSLVKGAGWLFGSEELQQLGQNTVDYWERTLSDTQREAGQKRFVNEDWSLGEAATDPNAYFGAVVQSLPHMVPGIGAAGAVGRGALAMGLSKKAASAAAATAGSAGEGVTIGAMVGQEVDESIKGMSEEEKLQSPYYADLRKLYSEEEATQRLSDMASNPAALKAGVVGGALGIAFNKFLGDALTRRLSGGPIKEGAKGAAIEGGTEVLQSGYESHSRQSALNEYAAQPMSYTDMVNEMVTGLAAGTVMGAGVGAAGGLQGRPQNEKQREPDTIEKVKAARDQASQAGADSLDATRAGAEELLREVESRPAEPAFDQPQDINELLDGVEQVRPSAPVQPTVTIADTATEMFSGVSAQSPSDQAGGEQGASNVVYEQDGVRVTRTDQGFEAQAQTDDGRTLTEFAQDPDEARRKLTRLIEKNRPKNVVLQNRDRSRPAYVEQMQAIANEPDYDWVSVSREPNAGAPMVFSRGEAATVEPSDMGATDTVTMSDGQGGTRKIPVRYAVVEADQVTASNNADGSQNENYGRKGLTALNNGRTAGLQAAFQQGTAQPYVEAMLSDTGHGISPEAIRAKNNPLLIRFFDESALEGIDDPGAASNVSASAELSAVEQAQTDARKLDPDLLNEIVPGEVTGPDNMEFVRRFTDVLGKDGQGNALRDAKGLLTAQGQKRIKGALVERAYQDATITQELTEAVDNDLKTLGDALAQAAGRWALMRERARDGAINPDMDITDALVNAVNMIRKSRQEGKALTDLSGQVDAFAGPADQMAVELLHLFYHGEKFSRIRAKDVIARTLLDYVDAALNTAPGPDMFGQTTTPQSVLEAQRGQSEETTPSRVQPDGTDDGTDGTPGEGSERRPGGQADAEEGAGTEPEPAGEVEADTDFDLETQTEEQLAEQARTQQEDEQAAANQRRQEAQRATADEQVDGFALTGSDRTADVAMAAGQDDMFVSTPASREVEQAGNQTDTNPTDGQKEAGNYRKGRVRVQGLEIAIENPKGSTRSGTDPDGNRWESTMAHHYGDIKGTTAADGDNLDVFIGPVPEIDQVFVIDQPNADGSFDEHKVMLGFPNEKAAKEGYLANYEDGWTAGPVTRMTMDEFKAWVRDGDTTKPVSDQKSTPVEEAQPEPAATEPQPNPEPAAASQEAEPDPQPTQPIEDFGEKLEGARKDYASKLAAAKDQDVSAVPLSKSWPEPNYQKMLDDGVAPDTVALIRALRDEVPTKPQKSWKLKGWVELVSDLREMAGTLMESEAVAEKVLAQLKSMKTNNRNALEAKHILGRMDLYKEFGHDDSFKGVTFGESFYQLYMGEKNVAIWEVERLSKATSFGNMPRTLATGKTREEALANLRKALDKLPESTKEGRAVRFNIYRDRYSNDVFIGKKIGKDVVRMKTFDDDIKAAREYLAENQKALEEQLAAMKDIPAHRRKSNSPRVGVDHRKGADVTPDQFAETFGFRGVQFGNYVEQGRRQADLNEAYDALMDMAGILDIPARALSLSGELGLAFGARGKGGKNAPMAHYEPGTIVINLTKKSGAGSLAHEWWHSLDNYFSRERGTREHMGYATAGQAHISVRPEVAEAFRNIRQTVNRIRMKERSRKLDKMRTKPYWSTDIEMSARAFESYVIERLRDQDASNDYLANIVSEEYWKAAEKLGVEDGGSYPYPEAAEIPDIRAAYDHFFDVVETRETEGGNVALFSRDGVNQTDTLAVEEAESIRDELMRNWKGAPDVIIRDSISEFPPGLQSAIYEAGAQNNMRGVLWRDNVYLLASRIPDRMRMEQVILHEVIGHYGLRKMLGKDMERVLNQIWMSHGGKTRAKYIIDRYFPDGFDVNNKEHRHIVAEELIAHLAEQNRGQTLVQRAVAIIREGLRKLGFTLEFTVDDIVNLLRRSRNVVENGGFETAQPSEMDAVAASKFSKAGRSGSDRAAWPDDFPKVPFAAKLGTAEKHPDYQAAKAGDTEAAQRLVDDLVTEDAVRRVKAMIGDRRPRLVPVVAEEASGDNAIPGAYAVRLAADMGLEVEADIVQSVRARRTGTGADYRLANHSVFDGPVISGQEYLVVDDTMTMGGTLAGLRGHIEANGGKVIGATTLTGFGNEGQLALTEKMRQDLWRKHGEPLNDYLQEEFGYGIDSLTQGEAGHFRKAVSLDAIRDRIAAAKIEDDAQQDDAGESSTGVTPPEPRFSLAGNRLDSAADHFDDLDDNQKSALGKIAPRTPRERGRDWLRERTDRWQTKVRQGMVDRFAALKDVDEALYGRDVVEGSTASSSWVLSQMSGAASGALQSMLTAGRLKFNTQEKVISVRDDDSTGLNDVLKKLGSAAEIERFFGWMAGNRSARLMAEGRENLFEADEVDALKRLNQGQTDDGKSRALLYRRVFNEFQQYRDDVLEIAETTGIITPEQRETWADEFYVPFYRLADNEGGFTGPKASGGISRQEAYKKLKGGTQNLNDLLENTMMNFHHLLQASLKNQAALQAMENSEALGIAREVQESRRDTENSTFVLRDGEKIWYEIDDPLVFKAVTALAHPGMNSSAMKVMRGFKRLFTNLTTTTPQFVVANLLRDSMQAAATSEVSKNVLGNMVKGSKAYGNKRTRAKMMASGGSFSFGHLYGENADELRLQITGGLAQADILRSPSMVPDAVRGLWRKWNEMTEFTENINRAAIYEQNAQDRGELYAAFKARDLMNFSQYGAWPAMRVLIDVVPFLNARLQGLDKIYRSGVKPGIRTAMGQGTPGEQEAAKRFWAVTGALALASIALYLNNRDDEEYQKLEEWQKDTYWFFRVSDDHAIFVPKPFEVGAIATLVERLTEQAVSDTATGELFAERLGHMLMDTFSFSPIPQMAQPALDIYANYDAFTGRPIESMGMERLSPGLRRRTNTTAAAVAGSRASSAVSSLWGGEGLSPVQVDHLIQGYFGAVGGWVAGTADTVWKTATGETAPDTHWYENQPIRRFYKNLGDEDRYTRYGSVFYEALKEVNRVYADIREYQKMGDLDAAMELIQENQSKLAYRRALNRVQQKLSDINSAMERVQRTPESSEYKRRELDRLRAMKNRIQEQVGKRLERISAAS